MFEAGKLPFHLLNATAKPIERHLRAFALRTGQNPGQVAQ
jgi:hypothetical protein